MAKNNMGLAKTVLYRVLIIDNDAAHANWLRELLRPHNLLVDRVNNPEQGVEKLRRYEDGYMVVILTISDSWSPWRRILEKLQGTCRRSNGWSDPLFLCVGRTHLRPESILRIERLGARYVREG
jgi:hypothetical protein